MACYDDVYRCFEDDDYEKIRELANQEVDTVLDIAATYSTRQSKLSAKITRIIIEAVIEKANLCHAIWKFDRMINGNKQVFDLDDNIMRLISLVENEAIIQSKAKNPQAESIHRQLLKSIGTCPEPDFDQLLVFVARLEISRNLPDDTMLITLERIRRRLKDDRVFFLTLYVAFIYDKYSQLILQISISREQVLMQLQEQGYELEEIPGVDGVLIAHPPENERLSHGETDNNPSPGTNWFTSQPRRHNNRRREL